MVKGSFEKPIGRRCGKRCARRRSARTTRTCRPTII